jgi:hypothetical protein
MLNANRLRAMRVHIQPLIILLGLLSCSVQGADDDPETILATLKQSLLDESLQQGVSMVTSGYVDSSGRLVESTYFSSSVDVNGVRVLEYLPEEDRQQQATNIGTLPPALQALAYGSCLRPRPVMKRNAVVSINQDTRSLPTLQSLVERSIFSTFQNEWELSVDTQRSLGNRYEDAYLGRTRTQNTDFLFQIELIELAEARDMPGIKAKLNVLGQQVKIGFNRLLQANPMMEVAPVALADPVALELVFTLVDLVQTGNNKEKIFYLLLSRDGSSLVTDNDLRNFEDGLKSRLENWRKALLPEDSCVLQFAYVHAVEKPKTVALNMGSSNGLKAGDRFLLLGEDLIKDGLLNADWSENMSIAKVVSLGVDRAQLEILTEPVLDGTDYMYALPF